FETTLKQLWQNPDSSLPGGESNLIAQNRALSFLQELEVNILRLVVKKSPTGESTHCFFFMLK
ncbi:histidine phosphatase family protein, partial [Streptococcus anginosus]